MTCRCDQVAEFWDEEAQRYATEHLRQVHVDRSGWISYYQCPQTGQFWIKEQEHGYIHGGGRAHLRKIEEEEVRAAMNARRWE